MKQSIAAMAAIMAMTAPAIAQDAGASQLEPALSSQGQNTILGGTTTAVTAGVVGGTAAVVIITAIGSGDDDSGSGSGTGN